MTVLPRRHSRCHHQRRLIIRATVPWLICLLLGNPYFFATSMAQQEPIEAPIVEAKLNERPHHGFDLSHSYPGGVVQLMLGKTSDTLPLIRFGTREPIIIEQAKHWQVLIGLSLNLLPGEYVVYIKLPDSELPAYSVKFDVIEKRYPIAGENTTTGIPPLIEHQHQSELDFSNTRQPDLPLELPLDGDWADSFGRVSASHKTSSDADEPRAQNYISYESTALAVVTAPQNGIVSRIIEHEGEPKLATVFLDHGRGLYSILSGLGDLSIETGNGVVRGAVLGKMSGQDQDGQPAKLIWQSMINGVYVNPLILTQLK